MKALLKLFISRGVAKKGFRGGSSLWLAIGALQFLGKLYSRKGKKSESVTLAERIRPGDELIVRYPGTPGRRTRREIAGTQKRVNAERTRFESQLAALESQRNAGGRRGRIAIRALAALQARGQTR